MDKGFGKRVSGFEAPVSDFGCRSQGFRFWASGYEFRVLGFGLRGSGFRFQGKIFGFQISGFGCRGKVLWFRVWVKSETGSFFRLIDSCTTQLKA